MDPNVPFKTAKASTHKMKVDTGHSSKIKKVRSRSHAQKNAAQTSVATHINPNKKLL